MCGFIFSCCFGEAHHHSPSALEFIAQRGPDSLNIIRRAISGHPILLSDGKGTSKLNLTVAASVLSLRGTDIVSQPLSDDETGSFLCWNGEAWKTGGREVLGNDSETIFSSLLDAVKYPKPEQHGKQYLEATADDVGIILGSVEGPFSFLFYDGLSHRVFYGRDELGRRSLLINNNADSGIIISSVSSEPGPWTEVEAKGIFTIDLATEAASHGILPQVPQITPSKSFLPSLIPWSAVKTAAFPTVNCQSIDPQSIFLDISSPLINDLEKLLLTSLRVRLRNIPVRSPDLTSKSRVAVLFSGGLDCSVLARLMHDILPLNESIDLLNVAFENPRVMASMRIANSSSPQDMLSVDRAYESCPDRMTGRSSYAELLKVCPGRRWIFTTINIPYAEVETHKPLIKTLMHPHNTEMDMSISLALYFAARGEGSTDINNGTEPYITPARVLLSGLGADELFGGYNRHSIAYTRTSWAGLANELELDFRRLPERNLGRDDRVISHCGKEVRYPYLDEALIIWALNLPPWQKCGFGQRDNDEKFSQAPELDPAKLLLRLLTWKLGMQSAANEKKRAIQFGSRTAKMVTGKIKGTHTIS